MENMYDIQQFLKMFGIIIYTGNRAGDIHLMAEEIKELRNVEIIDEDLYQQAMDVLLKKELGEEQ